eukprot:gene8305-10184_t
MVGVWALTGGTLATLAISYTAYDKVSGHYTQQRLMDLFGGNGLTTAGNQWNKLLGLTGMTLLGLATASVVQLPCLSFLHLPKASEITPIAASCIAMHSTLTLTTPSVRKRFWTIRYWFGMSTGILAFGALAASFISCRNAVTDTTRSLSLGLGLGFIHFLLMEGAAGGTLSVRPGAYFAVAAAVVPLTVVYFRIASGVPVYTI